tara:strand:- start:292 stop:426 length:135 start_codon:yes stop_codon:yes gene_type:complete
VVAVAANALLGLLLCAMHHHLVGLLEGLITAMMLLSRLAGHPMS